MSHYINVMNDEIISQTDYPLMPYLDGWFIGTDEKDTEIINLRGPDTWDRYDCIKYCHTFANNCDANIGAFSPRRPRRKIRLLHKDIMSDKGVMITSSTNCTVLENNFH